MCLCDMANQLNVVHAAFLKTATLVSANTDLNPSEYRILHLNIYLGILLLFPFSQIM